jgi:hypothetical protein
MAEPPQSQIGARKALLGVLTLAFVQDMLHALIFLSAMNHYLLDVLKTSPGLPAFTLSLHGFTKLVTHPMAGRLLDRTSPQLVFSGAIAVQVAGAALILTVHELGAFLGATALLAMGSRPATAHQAAGFSAFQASAWAVERAGTWPSGGPRSCLMAETRWYSESSGRRRGPVRVRQEAFGVWHGPAHS